MGGRFRHQLPCAVFCRPCLCFPSALPCHPLTLPHPCLPPSTQPALTPGEEDRGLLFQTDVDTDLLTAITDFFLPSQRRSGAVVHRLAIFDAHGSILHVVSQMDAMR